MRNIRQIDMISNGTTDASKKAVAIMLSILLLVSPVIVGSAITTKPSTFHKISVTVQANSTKIITVPNKIADISTKVSIKHSEQALKPSNKLLTNNKVGEVSKEIVYETPYQYEIYKKGEQYDIRLFVPEHYYDAGQRIEPEEVTFLIYYEPPDDQGHLFDPQNPDIDYLIITNETFYPILDEFFVSWKLSSDNKISSIFMTNVSDITANSSNWINSSYSDSINTDNPFIPDGKQITSHYMMFNDTQAQIRNFIRYYNDTHNTKYVLLAGNKDVVPPRMASTRASGDSCSSYDNDLSHASDLYYAALDYCANNNTNSYWMENPCCGANWDEVDYGIDVHVGRALVGNISQTFNWINKTKNYVDGDKSSNAYKYQIVACKDSGNNIDNQSWTGWYDGAFSGIELHDEYPANFTFVNGQNITQAQWIVMDDYVNGDIDNIDGINIIYHTGHGGTLNNAYGGCYNNNNCNNSEAPNFVYTEGCHSGNIGEVTNSRAEYWLVDDGCTFAEIVNSAYGWFVASTYFGEDMMSAMFNDTRGLNELTFCKAHDIARESQGSTTADGVWAMIFKESNFFGDPALEYQWYTEAPFVTISSPYPANASSVDFEPSGITTSVFIESDVFNTSGIVSLESYTENDDSYKMLGDRHYLLTEYHQVFQHNESDYGITNISLNITYDGLEESKNGTIYISIYNVSCQSWLPGLYRCPPTGPILSQGEINVSQVPSGDKTGVNYTWFLVNMSPVVLEKNEDYIMVFSSSKQDTNVYIRYDSEDSLYPRGYMVHHSTTGWCHYTVLNEDMLFNIQGYEVNNTNTFNISFSSNSEGSWQKYGNVTVFINTTYNKLNNNFSEAFETYHWNVSCFLNGEWENKSYYFIMSNIHFVPSDDVDFNGTTINEMTPTFAWTKISSTSKYWFQISNTSDFSTLNVNITNVSELFFPAYYEENETSVIFELPPAYALTVEDTYYCRVKAYYKDR